MVVVAITSLLAGMVLTYSSRGRTQVSLYVESAKLAQVILRAKSLAIATYNNPDTPCGYGVHLDFASSTYALFSYAPTSPGGALDCPSVATGPIDITSPAYSVIENFEMQKGVEFVNIGGGNNGVKDVLFLPPDPTTYLWLRDGSSQPATDVIGQIQLVSASDVNYMLRLRISSAGQISF